MSLSCPQDYMQDLSNLQLCKQYSADLMDFTIDPSEQDLQSMTFLCRWHCRQLDIELPKELSTLLEIHLTMGHRILCCGTGTTHFPYVFMDRHCKHMAESHAISHFWQTLLEQLGSRVIFPPHR